MTFEHPAPGQIPQLLALWKQVFGEWNGFWETFLETGFAPNRCRCIVESEQITASLTWLDCSFRGQKMAYIYAVVTHPDHRGKGLCRRLLADTHRLLKELGYTAALLVPAEAGLRSMYEKLSYHTYSYVEEFSCKAGNSPVPIRTIGPEEFLQLRRSFLPENSVLQEGENLTFLARQAQFYAGEDFLMSAWCEDGTLTAMELLGSKAAAPGILYALGTEKGSFRCPGSDIPFAMIHTLVEEAAVPEYFGFAFD